MMSNPVSESDLERNPPSPTNPVGISVFPGNIVRWRPIQYNIIDTVSLYLIMEEYNHRLNYPLSDLGFPERNLKPIINLCSEKTT